MNSVDSSGELLPNIVILAHYSIYMYIHSRNKLVLYPHLIAHMGRDAQGESWPFRGRQTARTDTPN